MYLLQCIISQLDKISSIFVDSQHICMQLYASFVEKIWKNDDGTENGDMPLSKYRKLVCF